jgi:putative two-component system response regulator
MDTILLVDDETMNLKILRTILRKGEYRFLEAESGEEALQLLEREKADLIVLDLMMPGMDGFQVLENVKSNPSTDFIPVIIASALKDSSAIERGLELGANDYFTKPLSDDDRRFQLPLKVRNLIKSKKMQDQLADLNHPLAKRIDKVLSQVDRMVEIVKKIGQITRYRTKEYAENVRIVDIDKSSGVNRKKAPVEGKVP